MTTNNEGEYPWKKKDNRKSDIVTEGNVQFKKCKPHGKKRRKERRKRRRKGVRERGRRKKGKKKENQIHTKQTRKRIKGTKTWWDKDKIR